MTDRIGVYPGTFDPVTDGHLDIIKRAANVVDKLIIAVASNAEKAPLFSTLERAEMVAEACLKLQDHSKIVVKPFHNLLIDFARAEGANVIMRGLRAVSDFEYEFQMAGMNARLAPDIEMVFLMASDKYQLISSRFVKEIARLGGDVSHFAPPDIVKKLNVRLAEVAEENAQAKQA